MEGAAMPRVGYALGPRVLLKARQAIDMRSQMLGPRTASEDAPRTSSTCLPGNNSNACEKPVGSSAMTLPIVLGVLIPLVSAMCVLIFLHRRNMKRQRREDAMDPHKSLDFGLGENLDKGGKGNRKSILGMGKDHSRYRQMSMDMNLSSPYLLPSHLHSSRESLHSLAKSLHQNEDPYRPVAQYAGSDAVSTRSLPKGRDRDGSSIYTGSSNDRDSAARTHSMAASGTYIAPPRQNSLPKSPPPPPEPVHMKPATTIPEDSDYPPSLPLKDPFRSPTEVSLPDFSSMPYPAGEPGSLAMPTGPVIQDPPAAAQRIARKPMSGYSASASVVDAELDMTDSESFLDHAGQPSIGRVGTSHNAHSQSPSISSHRMSPPAVQPLSVGSHPQLSSPPPVVGAIMEEPEGYNDHDYPQMAHNGYHQQEYFDSEDRGRSMERESMNYHQAAQTGLGVPVQDTRRLSVGLRPLPPDDVIESEDPETRANRIRSFYKEYFDDSKPDPMPAVNPPMGNLQHGRVDYYEDYDGGYVGDAPYYDPASNSFVMPYAQPVSRRAMTPPPSGSRFPGPRGGPRPHHHGSVGGMSMPGGRGPPRPGSASSSNYGPRPGSSVSNAWGRPRAGSAMSGRPRKPFAPPSTLTTLPNPSRLRDDSVALLGSIEFAPPETFKDRAAGRPQSPAGERRPYQLNVPIHSPLVNAFEELPTLPSPHLLRKSSTFTGLDFAPPRKFTDSDSRSETGSIRSNRSGMSTAQLSAIRSGAGRVSRLPEDSIFTAAQVQQKLKPSWTMRD